MARLLTFISTVTALAFLLTACGKDSAAPPAPAPEQPAAAPAPETPDPVAVAIEAMRADDEASLDAVVALGESARPALKKLLASGDVEQVAAILEIYARSGGLLPPSDLAAAIGRNDPTVQRLALKKAGVLHPTELFQAIVARLQDTNVSVRVAAAQALAGFRDPRVQQTLLPLLQRGDELLADAAAHALAGQIDPPNAPVLTLLKDPRPAVRRRALVVLGGRHTPDSFKKIAALVSDPDPKVQGAALEAIASFGSGRALEVVRPLALSDDVQRRRFGARALAHFNPDETIALAAKLLEDTDAQVRQAVTARLDHFDGQPSLAPLLIARLSDETPMVRLAAVEALTRMKRTLGLAHAVFDRLSRETDPRVLEAFGRFFKDRKLIRVAFPALVRELDKAKGAAAEGIARALAELTGQELGTDAWQWRRWAEGKADAERAKRTATQPGEPTAESHDKAAPPAPRPDVSE